MLTHVRQDEGPWLPDVVDDGWEQRGPAQDRDSLYCGIAGLAPVLVEVAGHRALDEPEQRLAEQIAARLRV